MIRLVLALIVLGTSNAFAQPAFWQGFAGTAGPLPPCMAQGQSLPINNSQVIQWKSSTQNQFLARAHVQGVITKLYPDHSGHNHFEIQIGSNPTDTLEVVYNQSFGSLPQLQPQMQIEACGDYITSIAQSGPYPPSPDGGILHWVHRNPSNHGHDSGYVAINGSLFGQGNGNGAFMFEPFDELMTNPDAAEAANLDLAQ